MNEDLYELAKKHLGALDARNISDIEVRHVIGERDVDRNNERENNIQINIYYTEPKWPDGPTLKF